MRQSIGCCSVTPRRDLKGFTFPLSILIHIPWTGFSSHSFCAHAIDSISPNAPPPLFTLTTFGAHYYHPLVLKTLSLMDSLSLHTIMFCSATFPIPPGEVIDIIRVTSNTLVPCWQWKIKSLTEYECECPNPATHAIRDSISFGWPDNHKIPYAPFRTSVNDLLVTMIRLEL